jgi:acetyl esterase
MPLNDALTAFLTEMAASGVKPIAESTPEEVRALTASLAELYGSGPEMERVEDRMVPVEGGSIAARVLVPRGRPRGVLIYYHGGGWVIGGNLDEFDTLGRKLADRTRCAVVLVDYRLAPEHRYPIAVDDSYAALEWVNERIAEIAGANVPIIVAGDSAGGNIAAVMARRSRDLGGPPIAFQALVYPVTDADLDNASYTAAENQLLLDRPSMVWFWDHYLPDADRRAEPDASPLRAGDLSGLPPAIVLTAEYDVLRDEGEAYADQLTAAGVAVERHRHAGQMHGFFTLLMVPGHEDAIDQIASAIDTHVPANARSENNAT